METFAPVITVVVSEWLLGSWMLNCNLDRGSLNLFLSESSTLQWLLGPSSPSVPTAASFSSHSPHLPEGPIFPFSALSPSSVQPRLLQTQQLRIIAVKCRCHLLPDFRPSSPLEPLRLLVVCGLEPQPLDCRWRLSQQAALGASPVPTAVLVTLWLLPRRPPPHTHTPPAYGLRPARSALPDPSLGMVHLH